MKSKFILVSFSLILAGCGSAVSLFDGESKSSSDSSKSACNYFMKRSTYVKNTDCDAPESLDTVVEKISTQNDGRLRIQMLPTVEKFQNILSITYEDQSKSTDSRELECEIAPANDTPTGRRVYYCTLPIRLGDDGTEKFIIKKWNLTSESCWANFDTELSTDKCYGTSDTTYLAEKVKTSIPVLKPTNQ